MSGHEVWKDRTFMELLICILLSTIHQEPRTAGLENSVHNYPGGSEGHDSKLLE